jgi:hypothetical protein
VQQIGDERTFYTFTVTATGSGNNYPPMRFVDWNGNLYYQFRHTRCGSTRPQSGPTRYT